MKGAGGDENLPEPERIHANILVVTHSPFVNYCPWGKLGRGYRGSLCESPRQSTITSKEKLNFLS